MSFLVVLVAVAIDLDNQRSLVAIEIRNVWSDRVLASELHTTNLLVSQIPPQDSFGWRCVGAERTGLIGRRGRSYDGFVKWPGVTPSARCAGTSPVGDGGGD